jgi:hypothetical protein
MVACCALRCCCQVTIITYLPLKHPQHLLQFVPLVGAEITHAYKGRSQLQFFSPVRPMERLEPMWVVAILRRHPPGCL